MTDPTELESPHIRVYWNHPLTMRVIQIAKQLDRRLRDARRALATGQLSDEVYRKFTAAIRTALARFCERLDEIHDAHFAGETYDRQAPSSPF